MIIIRMMMLMVNIMRNMMMKIMMVMMMMNMMKMIMMDMMMKIMRSATAFGLWLPQPSGCGFGTVFGLYLIIMLPAGDVEDAS